MTEGLNPTESPDTPDSLPKVGLIILRIELVGGLKTTIGGSFGKHWEAGPTISVGIVSVNAMLTPRLEKAPLLLTTFDLLGGFRRWPMFGQTGSSVAGVVTRTTKVTDGLSWDT